MIKVCFAVTVRVRFATVLLGLLLMAVPAGADVFINVGEISASLSVEKYWTLKTLAIGENVYCGNTQSHQGTVILEGRNSLEGQIWCGSGHGYETLISVEVTVDGQTMPAQDGMTYSGDNVVIQRQTELGETYLLTSRMEFTETHITETVQLTRTDSPIYIDRAYGFLASRENRLNKYATFDAVGQLVGQGETSINDNKNSTLPSAVAVAQYDPIAGNGILSIITKGAPRDLSMFIWDRAEDNKLYCYFRDMEGVKPMGTSFEVEQKLVLFEADAGDWISTAAEIAGQHIPETHAAITGRNVFYNNSKWDGNNPAPNVDDDQAVAPDKQALLPGQTATFANYTSFSRGINGIMVDIADLAGTPTASDFIFKVGNDNNPSNWPAAPASTVNLRPGMGINGSDRVTIVWLDGTIKNTWLQVTVKAGDNTGLTTDDVFYFGNAIGETGNSTANAQVTPTDSLGVRNNPHTLADNPAEIDDNCDFNRDRKVGPSDIILCRNNGTNTANAIQFVTVPN